MSDHWVWYVMTRRPFIGVYPHRTNPNTFWYPGQDCPVGYTFMTHTYSNPAVAETCNTDKPAKVCCPPGAVPQDCHWRGFAGTSCNAQCETGEIVLALDRTGDDGKATCAIGNKAYCCKSGERDAGQWTFSVVCQVLTPSLY